VPAGSIFLLKPGSPDCGTVNSDVPAASRSNSNPNLAREYNVQQPMIDLYNNDTNQLVGSITEADLQVLVDRLEEESETDQDYYIDQATIDMLGDGTSTDHLLQTLRNALGSADGVEVRWQRR
jgi:hypothetical protein